MSICRWTLLCPFWMDLCRRRWPLAPLHTSLLISGKRNWLDLKVKVIKRFDSWFAALFGFVLTLFSAAALSLEPYGLSLPMSMSSCSITDRQSPTLLSMSSGLSGDSTDLSHKGGYVYTTSTHPNIVPFVF